MTLAVLVVYTGSYLFLSRRGFALSRQADAEGFYFFVPGGPGTSRVLDRSCACFFYPLIVIDNWLGTGEAFAWSDPLWSVSGT